MKLMIKWRDCWVRVEKCVLIITASVLHLSGLDIERGPSESYGAALERTARSGQFTLYYRALTLVGSY